MGFGPVGDRNYAQYGIADKFKRFTPRICQGLGNDGEIAILLYPIGPWLIIAGR